MAGEEAPLPVDRQWETRHGDHYLRVCSLFSRKHGSGLACNPRPRWSGGSRITGCCRPDNLSGVEFMDYVRAGQVIRLGPHQTIVLLRGIGGAPQRPSILEGRQSAEITLAVLMRPFAVTWTEQRKTLIGCLPRSPACLDAMP
jgi:hypothetical protein